WQVNSDRMATYLVHRVAELEKSVVGLGETDAALARIFDLQRGIDGKCDRDGERDAIEPTARGSSHAVPGDKRAAAAKNKEKQEDHRRGMHVEGVLPRGRDVDH